MNVLVARLVPVAIVVFRYLMVCHAVCCQNPGGEKPLWRIVSLQIMPSSSIQDIYASGFMFMAFYSWTINAKAGFLLLHFLSIIICYRYRQL